jgi:hypothetical protein
MINSLMNDLHPEQQKHGLKNIGKKTLKYNNILLAVGCRIGDEKMVKGEEERMECREKTPCLQ